MPDDVPISIGRVRKPTEPQVLDAYTPLPGAIKQLNEPAKKTSMAKYAGQQEFARYAKLLVKHRGDPVPAIAELRQIPEAEVEANLPQLREELHRQVAGTDLTTLLEKFDVGLPNQIAVLHNHLYGDHLGAQAKAIEQLRELEGKANQKRQGQRAEDLIRLALGAVDG